MKRFLITLICLSGTMFLMVGADFMPSAPADAVVVKKHCIGYIVVEAGKGVDCNGDTLKLVNKGGYYGREIAVK